MKVLTIVGPTGVGKTEVAFLLAQRNNLEIISADSRQIYKYMDIGTAKPTKEMRERVKFHLLDIIPPDEIFNAQEFAKRAIRIMDRLSKKGKRFIISGGSGLYIRAIFRPLAPIPKVSLRQRDRLKGRDLESLYLELKGVDPISAARIHPSDRQRIMRALEVFYQTKKPFSSFLEKKGKESRYQPFYVGLTLPREILHKRIEERFEWMLKEGFVKEASKLLAMGYDENLYAFNALGYKEMMQYLKGEITLEEAVARGKKKTKEYAKRQLTWFKREDCYWIENTDPMKTVVEIERIFPEISQGC